MRMPPFAVLTQDWTLRQFAHFSKAHTIVELEDRGWTLITIRPLTLTFYRQRWKLIIDSSQGFAVYQLWTPKGNLIVIVP